MLIISDSVTHIGDNAFKHCSYLTSINIGNGVRNIGNSAFESCGSLEYVYIPANVEHIGAYAFNACTFLNKVKFAETNGWIVTTGDVQTSGKDVSSEIEDLENAAICIKSTYLSFYWKRNVNN